MVGEQKYGSGVKEALRVLREASDRLLKPHRRLGGRRGLTTTRPGSLLKISIPIKTFADWQENEPGFYLNTLCAVDVASGWTECLPVWGKGQWRVGGAVHKIRQRLPFSLLGLDSDNGNVVRRLADYDRYTSKPAYQCLERLYTNFFQPTMKLVSKTRHGANVSKVYDGARTPYQRLPEAGVLTESKRQELASIYHNLNPVHLLKQINENLESLW